LKTEIGAEKHSLSLFGTVDGHENQSSGLEETVDGDEDP
jgi:hypothetical protein